VIEMNVRQEDGVEILDGKPASAKLFAKGGEGGGGAGIKYRAMPVRFEEHRRDGARPASPKEIDHGRSHGHRMSVAQP
jgi:hypothetical protein